MANKETVIKDKTLDEVSGGSIANDIVRAWVARHAREIMYRYTHTSRNR